MVRDGFVVKLSQPWETFGRNSGDCPILHLRFVLKNLALWLHDTMLGTQCKHTQIEKTHTHCCLARRSFATVFRVVMIKTATVSTSRSLQ